MKRLLIWLTLPLCLFASLNAWAEFDRTDPADLAALHSELTTDPGVMGYDTTASITLNLQLLNDAAKNTGGEFINQRLTVGILLDQMLPSDFGAPQVTDGERRYIEAFMHRDFSEDIEQWRLKIQEAFRTNSTTATNINALTRPLSRAEVLFGANTVISRLDYIAARDFQP